MSAATTSVVAVATGTVSPGVVSVTVIVGKPTVVKVIVTVAMPFWKVTGVVGEMVAPVVETIFAPSEETMVAVPV